MTLAARVRLLCFGLLALAPLRAAVAADNAAALSPPASAAAGPPALPTEAPMQLPGTLPEATLTATAAQPAAVVSSPAAPPASPAAAAAPASLPPPSAAATPAVASPPTGAAGSVLPSAGTAIPTTASASDDADDTASDLSATAGSAGGPSSAMGAPSDASGTAGSTLPQAGDLGVSAASASGTASSAGSPPDLGPVDGRGWATRGLEYRFSLGDLKLYNGSALSYMPLEMGWRFPGGLRLRLGLELFYYQGMDTDAWTLTTSPARQMFNYEMSDLRLSCLYVWPLAGRLRPLAGLTVDSVGTLYGKRWISNWPGTTLTPPTSPPLDSPHSFEAPGVELGLEYRSGLHTAFSLEARYVAGVGPWASLIGTDIGWHYLFGGAAAVAVPASRAVAAPRNP